ncbi:glycosyltransferase family 4 protein [Pedobacter sp. SAFR-022]|uniref:glycosyltransferase family 4 protein n=1 Tax=Pedobacter sp. SAFR-022 TaxID=3436861 RepID=UPI003F7F82F2
MTLCYDNLVYSLQPFGGISTYWYELTRRLLNVPDVDLRFYETGREQHNVCRKQLNIAQEQVIRSNRAGILVERFLKLPAFPGPHLFHSSYFRIPERNRNAKIVTTVHDFIHDIYFSGPRVWLHNRMKRCAILESDLIITVSEHTRKDLLRFYPDLNAEKIKVIYNGVSETYKQLEQPMPVKRPYFLYVGLRDVYKNFSFAIDVAADQSDFDLYVVGPPLNAVERALLEQKLPGRYKVFTGLDESMLNELYNAAFCLLYPSEYEGFGIPILEAMRAGCPFIALNKSAIPEVAGTAGILLEAAEIELARQAVAQIQLDRQGIILRGLQQSQHFSWERCFDQTYELYKSLQS